MKLKGGKVSHNPSIRLLPLKPISIEEVKDLLTGKVLKRPIFICLVEELLYLFTILEVNRDIGNLISLFTIKISSLFSFVCSQYLLLILENPIFS